MIVKALKFLLPVALVVVGVMVAGWMINNPPTAERQQVEERITPVDILPAALSQQTIIVRATGTVTPAKMVNLRPEVTGRIVKIDNSLIPGGVFREGQMLASIDDRDYKFAVEAQKERVANAQFLLKQERGQQLVAQQEWALLEDSVPTTEEGKELALRKPQIERAEAGLEAAKSALDKANLDLQRTDISAPFNAIVLNESVDIGQVVNPQTQIASLAGTDQFWVQVSVPIEDLKWIDIPARPGRKGSEVRVIQESGTTRLVRNGYVIRLLGDLDTAGRLARLLVAVDDPLLLKRREDDERLPLLLGSFVNVEISGQQVESVYVIPRKALRDAEETVAGSDLDTGWVWLMNGEDRLQYYEVGILWRTEEDVYVTSGLAPGDRIVISNIPTPIVGMKLTLQTAAD